MRVLFLGSKPLGLNVLSTLAELAPESLAAIVTCDDGADGRSCLADFRSLGARLRLPVEVAAKPSALAGLLEKHSPDLVVVCGWYWKIPPEMLAKPAAGCVGLHASLLPRYRGFAPLVWSLLNGETEAGVSLFYLGEGLDTGDLLAQKSFPLSADATIADALRLAETGFLDALREVYPLLLKGKAPRLPQGNTAATYGSQRRPEDGRIDWARPHRAVHNAVRAQTRPYPGAFALVDKHKLVIWKTSLFPSEYYGPPGLVVATSGGDATVTCGSGAVILHEVQFEGHPPCPAAEAVKFGMRLS